jgi:hypothetical protein
MKTGYWIVLGLMNLFLICVLVGASVFVTYSLVLPQTQPEVVHDVKVVTIEVPIERIVEKIVTQEVIKEVIVVATPQPTAIVAQLPPPVIPTTFILPTKEPCTNVAFIETRTEDKIQQASLKVGNGYRLNTTLYNAGSCDWIGYKLVSINGNDLEASVPDTLAGQKAIFTITEGIVRLPIRYMLVMQDELGNKFPFAYGGTVNGCMEWTMETYSILPLFTQKQFTGFTTRFTCGPNG